MHGGGSLLLQPLLLAAPPKLLPPLLLMLQTPALLLQLLLLLLLPAPSLPPKNDEDATAAAATAVTVAPATVLPRFSKRRRCCGCAYVAFRYSCKALRSPIAMRRMLSVFDAHDDVSVDTADAECSENGAVEETSEAPDDEHADERFSAAARAAVAAAAAAAAVDLLVVLLPLPLPVAYDCVRVVKRGESSGNHSSGNLMKSKRARCI